MDEQRGALAAFCGAQYPRLVGFLSLYVGSGDLAEELAQDAVAVACRDWKKVEKMDSPEAWLYRVGINLANSHFRRRSAERRARERIEREPVMETIEHDPDAVEVRRAVAALPRRQRTALVARYFLGLSVAEAASLMQCAEGTVKALTHQAIKNLRNGSGSQTLREVQDVT
jgi:RNA polymerase sigma factor (sigma-70 family)